MTHFSTSTTHLLAELYYCSSYVGNKNDTKPATIWKYRQFFTIPKNQAKTNNKENCSVTSTNLPLSTTYRVSFLVFQSIMSFFA